MKKIVIAFIVIFVCVNFTIFAQDENNWPQLFMEASEKGDPKGVFKWLSVGAKKGDPIAQCGLAIAYLHGQGVEKNLYMVENWAIKSAEQGYVNAQSLLGDLYFNEFHDVNKAIYWWEKAAEQEDTHCMQNLGNLYFQGKEVPQDINKAFEWVKRASYAGDVDASLFLGETYYYGDYGFPVDYNEAFNWFNKAAQLNNKIGLYRTGYMLAYGPEIKQNLEKAFENLSKSAQLGYAGAYNDLAYFYAKGLYVPQNFSLALEMVDEAINLTPNSNEVINYYDSKGEILLMQNKNEEAIQLWNMMKKRFPSEISSISNTNFVKTIKSITNEN